MKAFIGSTTLLLCASWLAACDSQPARLTTNGLGEAAFGMTTEEARVAVKAAFQGIGTDHDTQECYYVRRTEGPGSDVFLYDQ